MDAINDILKDIAGISYSHADYFDKQQAVFAKVDALNKTAKGLAVGSHLKFSVADGQAHYIVAKVLKHKVQVVHLPIGDAWHFAGVYADGGKLWLSRPVAERVVRAEAALDELFGKKTSRSALCAK